MSHLPYLLSLALLAAILLLREMQHQKLVNGLLNKILIKQGLEPLPEEENPVTELLNKLGAEIRTPYNPHADKEKMDKKRLKMTNFKLPGADIAKFMGVSKDSE